ncbi:short chain dehydrogenase reductase family oxidoreductase [Fusarium mexicanum]|uniref:Short chain dehydrogenase reductase family oxidoreductase n=1 Tax=Fusarium mexicanum TaxID=751941 RepID=A0A8H5JC55_9HYPO|nr:short chain dehydrogenase reductase family oxidoreductase [Fusarium mexicanum]
MDNFTINVVVAADPFTKFLSHALAKSLLVTGLRASSAELLDNAVVYCATAEQNRCVEDYDEDNLAAGNIDPGGVNVTLTRL